MKNYAPWRKEARGAFRIAWMEKAEVRAADLSERAKVLLLRDSFGRYINNQEDMAVLERYGYADKPEHVEVRIWTKERGVWGETVSVELADVDWEGEERSRDRRFDFLVPRGEMHGTFYVSGPGHEDQGEEWDAWASDAITFRAEAFAKQKEIDSICFNTKRYRTRAALLKDYPGLIPQGS